MQVLHFIGESPHKEISPSIAIPLTSLMKNNTPLKINRLLSLHISHNCDHFYKGALEKKHLYRQLSACLGDARPFVGFVLKLQMYFKCPTLIQPPGPHQPKILCHPHEDSYILQFAPKGVQFKACWEKLLITFNFNNITHSIKTILRKKNLI